MKGSRFLSISSRYRFLLRKIVVYIVAFTLSWAGIVPTFAVGRAKPVQGNEPVARAESFNAAMEKLYSSINRADFDLDALIERHAYDVGEIISFAREAIHFEQYPGLLRGAQGTLLSRAGNSLDQALLLATLLKNNGEEARILRTNLSPAQVQKLMPEINPYVQPIATLSPEVEATAATISGDQTWKLASPEMIGNILNSIISGLGKEGISLGDSSVQKGILEEARDYFWVEYRAGPSQPWISVHPVFTNTPGEFNKLQFTEVLGSNIAEDLQHRFRLQAFIEQKSGSRLLVHEIMEPWERPTANLTNKSLSFSTLPSGLTPDLLLSGWDEILAKSRFFIPSLNGKPAPGGKAFDLDGNAFSLDDMSKDAFGAAPLFQTVGGKTENAAGALGSLGNGPDRESDVDLQTLTAVWLEYTLIVPGEREHTIRRMLLDRLGPTAREKSDVFASGSTVDPRSVVSATSILVTGGEYSSNFLDEQFLKSMQYSHDLAAYLIAGHGERKSLGKKSTILDSRGWTLPQLGLTAATQRLPLDVGSTVFRSAPGVIVVQYRLNDDDSLRGIVDIVTNSRRAMKMEKGVFTSLPQQIMAQGIWETIVEGVALTNLTGKPVQHALHRSALENSSYTIISEPDQIVEHGWPQDIGVHMRDDLERGYTLVVPVAHAPGPGHKLAWWRVDPRTGESLGIDSEGRGGVTLERMIIGAIALGTLTGIILSLVGEDYLICRQKNPKARSCCMEKRRNRKFLSIARGVGVNAWVKAVHEMENVRIGQCGSSIPPRLPAPTRP